MIRRGVAVENWRYECLHEVELWLEQNFGHGGIHKGARWNLDYDYDLRTLCMDEDVYTFYCLKWK